MCNWLIQETHPKSVLVFKRWTYYMIQQYLMQGSINGYDAFSVHRCINMHMYMQMCAIWGIYVGIHVHVRKCFILEELCTVSVLHSQNNLLGIIDIGAHKPQCMASSPLCQVLYISCILALPLYSSPLYMNCMSLGNKLCFIVIAIVMFIFIVIVIVISLSRSRLISIKKQFLNSGMILGFLIVGNLI